MSTLTAGSSAARAHRKCLQHRAQFSLAGFKPAWLNPLIGLVFAIGAALFALASTLALQPALASRWSLDTAVINQLFFAGSIPFTLAAGLQLLQTELAGDLQGRTGLRWRQSTVGWLSCALQFGGTLLFNVNTWEAIHPGPSWQQQDLAIWLPNLLGSLLFLASGCLAWLESCHGYWAWRPRQLDWWISGINLGGCLAFMLSACFAFVPPAPWPIPAATIALLATLLGAIAFLLGALLLLWER